MGEIVIKKKLFNKEFIKAFYLLLLMKKERETEKVL